MRYTQPDGWTHGADYSGYLKDKVSAEDYLEYLKLRKHLTNLIPKLGEIGVDELILKLASFQNSETVKHNPTADALCAGLKNTFYDVV